MKLGLVTVYDESELTWVCQSGFESVAWARFQNLVAEHGEEKTESIALKMNERLVESGIRISTIGAYYSNAMDPAQKDLAEKSIRLALRIAELLDVDCISCFSGGFTNQSLDARSGIKKLPDPKDRLTELAQYWRNHAKMAADKNIQIAFEHCPQTKENLPIGTYNTLSQVHLWDDFFHEIKMENVGLEWDPSHLVCQLIDPLENIETYGDRIFHVHGKDAVVHWHRIKKSGIANFGSTEHRFPGSGTIEWSSLIQALLETGSKADLNIEGWHNSVYRQSAPEEKRVNIERECFLKARDYLRRFIPSDID